MIVILMGVSGCGKTRVGQALARRQGLLFLDADDHHPPANIDRMRRGQPLTDADRFPWLDSLNALLRQHAAAGLSVVLACSALRQVYRDRLQAGVAHELQWVFLHAEMSSIRQRVSQRPDHFMPASLIRSQFETLEPPVDALVVDASQPMDRVLAAVERGLRFVVE